MSEANKALAREFYEKVNAGDLSVIDSHIADDFIEHEAFPGITQDKAGIRQFFEMMRAAFPDFRLTAEDVIAEGDKLVVRFRMHGTHRGEFMGMPATGRQIDVAGVDILRLVNGKAVEHWGVTDTGAMMQQLGMGA